MVQHIVQEVEKVLQEEGDKFLVHMLQEERRRLEERRRQEERSHLEDHSSLEVRRHPEVVQLEGLLVEGKFLEEALD